MSYLGWYSDNPKHTIAERIKAGALAYEGRFGILPAVVLVNEAEAVAVEGVRVIVKAWVRKSNYLFGVSDC